MIKAIETRYKGYNFRSRLEARWAVFFDALGIEWEYEPEGFELPDGTRYLPDFRIKNHLGLHYVEIKGVHPSSLEVHAADQLAKGAGCCVLILYGTPGEHGIYRCGPGFTPRDDGLDATNSHIQFHTWAWLGFPGTSLDVMRAIAVSQGITAARSARFEHGQSGATA